MIQGKPICTVMIKKISQLQESFTKLLEVYDETQKFVHDELF